MKTRIAKILGVVLTVTLLSSLAMVAAPVSAVPGVNAWGGVAGPPIVTGSGVGVMEVVESDGTIFAAVVTAGVWHIQKSSDEGKTWTATSFNAAMANPSYITDIVASPNYAVDKTFYVSLYNGRIYRIKGTDAPVLLKTPVDSFGITVSAVFDLDTWFDGSDVWILAATNLDVLVMRDALFEPWRDQELAPAPAPTVAFEAAFAPDFYTSNLIWAAINYLGVFRVTATISPGQWGNTVGIVTPQNAAMNYMAATPWCELDFADTYSAAAPVVYFACSDTGNHGNIFEIRGAYVPGITQAIPLLLNDSDCHSVEVSGNVILVGKYWNFVTSIWRSDNLGDTFAAAVKPPTGFGRFEIEMAPGMFDPNDGVAYCSSQYFTEDESAFSVSRDGGETWNQTAWVDSFNDLAPDMAFAPFTASQPAFLITVDLMTGISSLWRTDDVTAAPAATWVRVQNSRSTGPTGLVDFYMVEYSMDGTTVMLYGEDVGGNAEIWKSTDNGQTFNHWRTLQTTSDEIMDIVVFDGATIFAACDDSFGFLGTTRFGPAKERLLGVVGVSIALQPGFDPDDPAKSTVILGDASGNIYVSLDAGNTWSGPQSTLQLGDVFVAFDSGFSTNGLIYFATGGSTVGKAKLTGAALGAVGTLFDAASGSAVAPAGFSGIAVSPDNALYAIGGDQTTPTNSASLTVSGTMDLTGAGGAFVDEYAFNNMPVTFVSGLPFTSEAVDPVLPVPTMITAAGYNSVSGIIYIADTTADSSGYFGITLEGLTLDDVLVPFVATEAVTVAEGDVAWTVTATPATTTTVAGTTNLYRILLGEPNNVWETAAQSGAMGVWVTEGSNYVWTMVNYLTIAGLQDTVSGKVAGATVSNIGETSAKLAWTAMFGATKYEYSYNPTGMTTATTVTLTPLTNNTAYSAKVRVAPGFPFASRWSSPAAFTTLEAIGVPSPEVPEQGLQGAPLLPSFVWEGVANAVSYDFQLGIDPGFATTLISTSLTVTGYTYAGPELAYDLDHYWRVRAVSATGTKSAWCTVQNFHTRVEVIVVDPIILPDPVTPVVTVNLPAPQVTVVVPDITVISPDVVVDIPDIVTITQTQAAPITLIAPEVEDAGTPVYIWVIVGIGAILTIAVIVLIIRTRRVV